MTATQASKLLPLPAPVATIGPCMFGGQPSVETPVFTADQMRDYAAAALAAQQPVGDVKNFDSYEIHFAPIDRSGLDVELVRASLYEKLLKQHEELLFAAREFHLWTKERIADEFLVRQQGRDDLKIRLYKTIDRWMAEESNLCSLMRAKV